MRADFERYLRAKRTVDDRAIDRRLLEAFREGVAERAETGEGPLRVLEVGAGIGTMPARLLEWEVLPPGEIRYAAVDVDPDTVAGVGPYLREWADGREVAVSGSDPIEVKTFDRTVRIEPIAADAIEYAERTAGEWDVLLGAALLDVLESAGLETLLGALAPGGTYYFPITFDGATRFRPSHPADLKIERHYHDHMDAKPGGNSRAGGAVLEWLRRTEGVRVSGVAGSDWIVRPTDGEYPADEAFFLGCILDSVESAVDEVTDGTAEELDEWMACRRAQLGEGELCYLTHQLDLLGRVDGQ